MRKERPRLDFYNIVATESKSGTTISPSLKYSGFSDLMIRGRDFYAIWDETNNRWEQDGNQIFRIVDDDLRKRAAEIKEETGEKVNIKLCSTFNSQVWHDMRKMFANSFDNFRQLDTELTFANTETKREDYRSKRLPYALLPGDCPGYDELMDTLYDPDERDKLEWAIGAIVAGRAKYIQKFVVLYGEAGTGKSTVLDIIQKLFEGYYVTFDAKALGSANRQFATEVFRSDPLVAIQHDGDLSKIESNETLNSVVSHEEMTLHVKYKSDYSARINAFLFMGTNKPVRITDAKSGIIRRLIDVSPSGRKLPVKRYNDIMKHKIPFELGAIAWHCKEVFEELGEDYYNNYRPINMMFATDHFINFVELNMLEFERDDYITLNRAWAMYKEYCSDSAINFMLQRHTFRSELMSYFKDFKDTWRDPDGHQLRSVFIGFRKEKFDRDEIVEEEKRKRVRRRKKGVKISSSDDAPSDGSDILDRPAEEEVEDYERLVLDKTSGEFDILLADCPAQYATSGETPSVKWENCRTKLKDIDPTKLHYVRPPENMIVIDFDLKDTDGQKSLERNLEAASKWPATYAELSKGGAGLHLHYYYVGDIEKLSALYSPGIEIKKFTGKSSLRRKLTYCNDLPIANINSGLPQKEAKKVVDFDRIADERHIRNRIAKALRKEVHAHTKPCINFIFDTLEKAYNQEGLVYNVEDLRSKITSFGAHSHNNPTYCLRIISKMRFKSKEEVKPGEYEADAPMVVYDCEVFPNLLLVCWKQLGEGHRVVRMFNPSSSDIEHLMKFRLISFNGKEYDSSIIYARYIGYNNYQIYQLSQKLINTPKSESWKVKFREAENLEYVDIRDFSAQKQSLKKWELDLHIHHLENSYPWDEPLPEDKWEEVGNYCENDVLATEQLFYHLQGDFIAREILADIAGMPVNTSTNKLVEKILFQGNKHPELVYTDLRTGEQWTEERKWYYDVET